MSLLKDIEEAQKGGEWRKVRDVPTTAELDELWNRAKKDCRCGGRYDASIMTHRILTLPGTETPSAVRLAADELAHWLERGCRGATFGRTRRLDRAQFVLATFDQLREEADLAIPFAEDAWQDAVLLRSDGNRLVLAGSNPRSVLFAVYTYLDRLGFAWVLPGPDGEVVPKLTDLPTTGFDEHHQASLTIRGIAAAGAYDGDMGEAFITWMARNRFNHLFLEGDTCRPFFQQMTGRKMSLRDARRMDRRLERAAHSRGMTFERMGHGWTGWVLGIPPGTDRQRRPLEFAEDVKPMVAKGKDQQPRSTPLGNLQLCLSNEQARQGMIDRVCQYAAEHPEIDVLAVWLGDGFNNWCECVDCQQVHPSDAWVRLINRIAPAVYEVRPDLSIEVLSYCTLMEPPPTETIDNSRGNVILLYAPFLRCYHHRLDDPACRSDVPLKCFPPVNQLHHPMNGEFFGFFKQWLANFNGTNYVFDYYAWLPIKRDIFEGDVAKTLCHDLQSYPAHGITGMVDCSRVQSFWPTPLLRWLQARTSWDASVDYQQERRRLLELIFGSHAAAVDRYLTLTYDHLTPDRHARAEERTFDAQRVRQYRDALPAAVRDLAQAIRRSEGTQRKLLRRVMIHARFTRHQLDGLLAEVAGDFEQAMVAAERFHALATRHRATLAGVVDPPEVDWLRRDTLKRLSQKQAGTWTRID